MLPNLSKAFIGFFKRQALILKFRPSVTLETPQSTFCHCRSIPSPKLILPTHLFFFFFVFFFFFFSLLFSLDFLIKCPKDVDEDTKIVRLDVITLYTSIPHEFGLEVLDYLLTTYQEDIRPTFKREYVL